MRQINQLKKEFLALSDNGNGTISVNELAKLLREVKKRNNIPEREIARILTNADKDGSGEIEVHEFLGALATKKDREIIINKTASFIIPHIHTLKFRMGLSTM